MIAQHNEVDANRPSPEKSTTGESDEHILEGIFAVSKPPTVTTPQVLLDLQEIFAKSNTFASLLSSTRAKRREQNTHQPPDLQQKDSEASGRYFRMGHGGTLDPLASGVLIVGIGRGTKDLARFLGGTKTYECVVVFGKSTDTFDAEGSVTGEAGTEGVSEEVVRDQLGKLMGSFKQVPPIYSALKINGVKACEYVRSGQPLPRELEAREVHVDLCELVEFMPAGSHTYRHQLSDPSSAAAPAARIRLTVSSGFYVRSFCHNIGIACGSLGTMADLVRTRQSGYTLSDPPESLESSTAITFGEFVAGEEIWGPKIAAELKDWMEKNPVPAQDRSRHRKRDRTREGENSEKGEAGVRQRFRGEWLATTKKERIKQQGGKRKGKYNQPKSVRKEEEVPQTTTPADGKNNQ